MTIFDENLILETINMIKLHSFDIRTVTLSISLRDCISENINNVCDKIQYKLDKYASNLVKYANELENDYSIPIVNKRIAVTPISIIGEASKEKDYLKIAHTLENSAHQDKAESGRASRFGIHDPDGRFGHEGRIHSFHPGDRAADRAQSSAT